MKPLPLMKPPFYEGLIEVRIRLASDSIKCFALNTVFVRLIIQFFANKSLADNLPILITRGQGTRRPTGAMNNEDASLMNNE